MPDARTQVKAVGFWEVPELVFSFLFIYLRIREFSGLFHWLTAQLPAIAETRLGQRQELGTQPRSPTLGSRHPTACGIPGAASGVHSQEAVIMSDTKTWTQAFLRDLGIPSSIMTIRAKAHSKKKIFFQELLNWVHPQKVKSLSWNDISSMKVKIQKFRFKKYKIAGYHWLQFPKCKVCAFCNSCWDLSYSKICISLKLNVNNFRGFFSSSSHICLSLVTKYLSFKNLLAY